MTSIYKLALTGVRSFFDEGEEVLQFGTPLTLIVGQNGSGKTTIIESLRYATTGEVPPNTNKGVSFVSDPSLHFARETKAHVKLAFKNVSGQQMILTKNMMVSRNDRSKGLSFKTKENQLKVIDNHGNKQTMSSKVADIEKLIPQYLGVNKAILEYVIFCHQEDSLWPISDSATLKKKFDEIFDSVKFIDALNEIKKISSALNIEIKELTIIVEHLLEDKKRYLRKSDSINQIQDQIDAFDGQIIKFEALIQQDTVDLNDLHNTNQDFEQIISKMQTLQQQRESIEQNIQRIESTTDILHQPQELLQSQLNDFVNVVASQRMETNRLKELINIDNNKLESLRRNLNDLLVQAGQYKAAYDNYHANKERRNELIKEYAPQINVSNISEFDFNLNFKIEELQGNYQNQKISFEKELNQLNSKIQEIKNEQTKENQHMIYINEDITTQQNKKTELQNRLISISNNQTKLQTLRQELNEKQTQWDQLESQNEIVDINDKLISLQSSIPQYELELERCQENMKIARRNGEVTFKIGVITDLNKSSNRYLSNLLESVAKNFPSLEDDINEQYQEQLTKTESDYNEMKSKCDGVKSQLSQLKYALENQNTSYKNNQTQYDQLEANIDKLSNDYKKVYHATIDFEDFDKELIKVEEGFDEENRVWKYKEFLIDYYRNAIQYAQSKGACQLCHSQLKDSDDHDEEDEQFFNEFIKHLKHQQRKLEDQSNDASQVEYKKDLLNKLRNSKHEVDRFFQIRKDITAMELSIRVSEESINEKEMELKALNNMLNDINSQLSRWKLIAEDVKSISRVKLEIEERDNEINKMSTLLAEQGLTLTNEELEAEYKRINDLIKSSRTQIDTLRLKRDEKQAYKTEFLNSLNELKLKINDLELKSIDKVNIEKAIVETEDMLIKLEQTLKSITNKLSTLKASLDEFNEKNDKLTAKRDDKLKIIQKELDKFQSIKNAFEKVDEAIEEYEASNGNLKYETSQSESMALKQSIEKLDEKIRNFSFELNDLEAKLADSNNQERTIRFNIDYLVYQNQLYDIVEEIESINVEEAKIQKSEYLIKSRDLQQRQIHHQKVLAGKLGEKTQLEKQIQAIQNEIDRDFKDIDKRHADKFMELQTKLALATDLSTCYKATDDSILKYHQSQMSKINNIIDELWKKTYMGNDIETIQIQSDPIAAKKKTTTSARNNRSYNYRVVMLKNGVELDMRGRCSAGQKVLASIIIRIALAECFGTSCGMITLDEPTTNLDEENIESLARALHSIIEDRREQRNFQLIIITHDEKFLRMLNAVDFTEYYYKVERNERLSSTINKVKINTITN